VAADKFAATPPPPDGTLPPGGASGEIPTRAGPPPASDGAIVEPPPERIGHYRIEEEIGRGGMGIVWRATDELLGRSVAIKSLPPAFAADPARRARLAREAKLLALVQHPRIATIHAVEELDGRPFLVLEHVPGESLARRLHRGPIGIAEALKLACHVAEAVEAAHGRGVVHRDLKPANICVLPDGDAKVLDFGLAKVLAAPDDDGGGARPPDPEPTGADATRAGRVVGTPSYMSPEQLRADPVDGRADLWAIGCVLFECLAGRKPWPDSRDGDRARAIEIAEPDWTLVPAQATDAVRKLLASCLEKDPARRVQTAGALRAALEDCLAEVSVSGARRAVAARRGNLPRQLPSFIGRERELAELRELLAGSGLVTIVGLGGCGKTRLALEAASGARPARAGGTWLVDLLTVADGRSVPQAFAAGLGVATSSGDVTSLLADRLADRDVLIVADNCEHVLHACATLLEGLMRSCADLRVLATSREPLGLPGERVLRLEPLETPRAGARRTRDDLARFDSVRLFVERARSATPGFDLTEQDAEAVAQVCERLDGIPLAIELAAARLRVLSVGQVAARLTDRFRLLSGGGAGTPARHQTLRTLVDWSHDQLGGSERALFRRLAVFSGAFTLEAAESVGASAGVPAAEVLDVLSALVDRSLVSVTRRGAEVRFRLLETLRDYGRERLREGGDEEATLERHLDWCVREAEDAAAPLGGHEGAAWAARLDDVHEDMVSALRLAASRGRWVERALRLGAALQDYWEWRGHVTRGRELLGALLDATRGSRSPARTRALNAAGHLAHQQSDVDAARALHAEALELATALGDEAARAQACKGLGLAAFDRHDLGEARANFEASLAMTRRLGTRAEEAKLLNNLGNVAWLQGDLAPAARLREESIRIHRELGDMRGVARGLANLGLLAFYRKDHAAARPLLEESLQIRRDLGDRDGAASALLNLASVCGSTGDVDGAHTRTLEALETFRELGNRAGLTTALNNLASLEVRLGHVDDALRLYHEALRVAVAAHRREHVVNVIENIARAELAGGRAARAARLVGAAEARRAAQGIPLPEHDREEQDATIAKAREMLGAERYAEERAAGAALDAGAAVALALGRQDAP
jgi:non-specific serine/threonine protein kinase